MDECSVEERAVGQPLARDLAVMKFGGTSVENAAAIRRVVGIVREQHFGSCVVVVSALAGVTDRLLSLGEAAARGRVDEAVQIVESLRNRHLQLACELVPDASRVHLWQWMEAEFGELGTLAQGVAALGEFSPRVVDRVLAFGEVLSSRLVAEVFDAEGVKSAWIDSRQCIVTDNTHTCARPLHAETERQLRLIVGPVLEGGKIAVLGGFVGATCDGVPTTLGRGGSDLSAALVGAELGAQRIEIWTDVDGIMTADPRLCPEARVIPEISFELASELAHFGAKVLHPATLIPAMSKKIPVYVRNSHQPKKPGTRILSEDGLEAGSVSAITVKKGIASVSVTDGGWFRPELLRNILQVCERQACGVEQVLAAGNKIELLVSSVRALPKAVAELEQFGSVAWENHKALVSVVSDQTAAQPENAQRLVSALADLNVRLLGRGIPGERLSVLVDEAQVENSVQRLHSVFFSAQETRQVKAGQAGR
jgi:aspartate kinase